MTTTCAETYSVNIEKSKVSGHVVRETWTNGEGQLHRTTGPAFQLFDEQTGQLLRREFRINGIQMWDDGPCLETWDESSGKLKSQVWANASGAHRDGDLPAIAVWCPKSGILLSEEYFQNGTYSRQSGPCRIMRDEKSGVMTLEEHYSHGLLHRDGDQPAIIHREPEFGVATLVEFYHHGQLMRTHSCDPSPSP